MPGIDANCILMLHCDGTDNSTTFTDSSPAPISTSATGSAKLKTATKKFGSASGLMASGGVTIGAKSDFDFLHKVNTGTGQWTIDFQYLLDDYAQYHKPYRSAESGGDVGTYILFRYATGNIDCGILRGTPGTYVANAIATGAIPNDTTNWHHYEISYDHSLSSDNMKIFVDGILKATATKTTDVPSSATMTNPPNMWGQYGGGYVDEYRVSNIVRHTANFTPPTAPYDNTPDSTAILTCNSKFWGV